MDFINQFLIFAENFYGLDSQKKIDYITNKIININLDGGYIYIAGNGGSHGNISHVSNDLIKNGNIDARILSDISTITCLSNDYGFENIHVEYIKRFNELPSLIIICSVSGESSNLVNLLQYANNNNIETVVMTGFAPLENSLIENSNDIKIEIPSNNYNVVEIMHIMILLSVVESVISINKKFNEY